MRGRFGKLNGAGRHTAVSGIGVPTGRCSVGSGSVRRRVGRVVVFCVVEGMIYKAV